MKSLDLIFSAVAEEFHMSEERLRERTKDNVVAYPRHIFMFIAFKHFRYTVNEIAEFIDRDRTTVVHGVSKIEDLTDSRTLWTLDLILSRLGYEGKTPTAVVAAKIISKTVEESLITLAKENPQVILDLLSNLTKEATKK